MEANTYKCKVKLQNGNENITIGLLFRGTCATVLEQCNRPHSLKLSWVLQIRQACLLYMGLGTCTRTRIFMYIGEWKSCYAVTNWLWVRDNTPGVSLVTRVLVYSHFRAVMVVSMAASTCCRSITSLSSSDKPTPPPPPFFLAVNEVWSP